MTPDWATFFGSPVVTEENESVSSRMLCFYNSEHGDKNKQNSPLTIWKKEGQPIQYFSPFFC